MNRARREGECFQCYRRHLKEEQAEVDQKLKKRIVWTSSMIVEDKKDDSIIPKLVKIPVRGTFNRRLGHDMPNSLCDKHKRERLVAKLKKRGVIK